MPKRLKTIDNNLRLDHKERRKLERLKQSNVKQSTKYACPACRDQGCYRCMDKWQLME